MKRVLSIILVFALTIVMFASCKKNENITYSGSVMLYTTISEEAVADLKLSFEKEYPGVVLDYYYGDIDRVSRKIDTEYESGQMNADVVFLSDVLYIDDMKNNSRLEAYESKEARKIPKEYKDSENYYFAGAVTTMGLAFNKNPEFGIDEKSLPKTYNDFLNNDFNGKMALADPRSDSYVKFWVMAMMQNKNYGDVFFRRLRDYGIVIRPSERDVLDNIVGAVYSFGLCYDENSVNFTKEFEDFGFNYLTTDNVTMPTSVALVKDSVNPVNGKLLIDYILSKKGQDVLIKNGFISARTDAKNVLDSKSVISKSIKVDIEDLKIKGNDYITLFRDIFGD
ncbi:MAG: extracellular solute-binding protein [Lachnospiraceae bacterium]|nr:extracellular solute-binding protein [Lachnospiraceae bacterium]